MCPGTAAVGTCTCTCTCGCGWTEINACRVRSCQLCSQVSTLISRRSGGCADSCLLCSQPACCAHSLSAVLTVCLLCSPAALTAAWWTAHVLTAACPAHSSSRAFLLTLDFLLQHTGARVEAKQGVGGIAERSEAGAMHTSSVKACASVGQYTLCILCGQQRTCVGACGPPDTNSNSAPTASVCTPHPVHMPKNLQQQGHTLALTDLSVILTL
jgi:hypothetical protein